MFYIYALLMFLQQAVKCYSRYGHALGLDHTPDSGPNSVMKQAIQDIGPTSYDTQEIRLKWGN